MVLASAAQKTNRWILNTGASNHMMKHAKVSAAQIYKSSKTIRINTANGPLEVTDRAYLSVPTLNDNVEVILLPETPAALSLGRLFIAIYVFI